MLPGEPEQPPAITDQTERAAPRRRAKPTVAATAALAKRPLHGFHFVPPAAPRPQKPKRAVRKALKNDPELVAAARELRDRWLERVNSGQYLPVVEGKYDVTRQLADAAASVRQTPLLNAA